MADHRDDIRIGDEFLRGCHRLGRVALIIERIQRELMAGNDRPLHPRMLNGQQSPIEHVLALRRLIAGQRGNKSNFNDGLSLAAAGKREAAEEESDG